MKILVMILSIIFGSAYLKAEEVSFKLSGNVNVAYGSGGAFLNFGGPNIKLDITQDYGIGLSLYPSLRLNTTKNTLATALGFGPLMQEILSL